MTGRRLERARAARVRHVLASRPAGVAVLSLAAGIQSVARAPAGRPASYVLAYLLFGLGATAPIALLSPPAAAATVTAANLLSLALVHRLTVAGSLAELIALYRLTRLGGSRRAITAVLATALAACFVLAALAGRRPLSSEASVLTLLLAACAPAAAWAGTARRHRAEAALQSAAHADIADELLEHTARRERARIAGELHDVVAHHISMISVQAETARLAIPGMPDRGADRLRAIGDMARAALADMHQLLGVLRADAGPDVADRRPQPGLDQLAELLDQARDASGSAVRLILSGPSVPLDPVVELAAYRIAQEGLTNARRHAPGAAVDVELRYSTDALQLRIRDNGPGPGPDSHTERTHGHGLTGMHERAVAVGGELRTSRAPGGGFLVEARLPAKTGTAG